MSAYALPLTLLITYNVFQVTHPTFPSLFFSSSSSFFYYCYYYYYYFFFFCFLFVSSMGTCFSTSSTF